MFMQLEYGVSRRYYHKFIAFVLENYKRYNALK